MRNYRDIALALSIFANILLAASLYRSRLKTAEMGDVIALAGTSLHTIEAQILDGNLKNSRELSSEVIGVIKELEFKFKLKGAGWDHFDFKTKEKTW